MIYDRVIHQYRDKETGITVFLPTDKIIKTEDMEKSITITAPEGYEVDKERSSYEKIVFRALPEKGLPKTWKELGSISGYWTDSYACILGVDTAMITTEFDANKGVWPTREEAEASIALAQLCQLRDRYNGGWKPNWGRESREFKHCINIEWGKITSNIWSTTQHVLAFKTPELRDEFMKNFADLIEKAKPLLG